MSSLYSAWLDSMSSCCAVGATRHKKGKGLDSFHNDLPVLYDQPMPIAPPTAAPTRPETGSSAHARASPRPSSNRGIWSSKGSVASRKRLGSNASSRRPQISNPSNFRHIQSDSFSFPRATPPPPPPPPSSVQPRNPTARRRSFRPLELSIYEPQNKLSPLLSHFDYDHPDVPEPPPVRGRSASTESHPSMARSRSYSSMSFHVPRRAIAEQPSFSSGPSQFGSPPRIPPKALTRQRAFTSPSVEAIVERIATAMNEMERLQEEIDEVVERQSIYVSSRPTTAYGIPDAPPLPEIPAIPTTAASFAERLSTDTAGTAPIRPVVSIPKRSKSFEEASAVFHSQRSNRATEDVPEMPLPMMAVPVLNRSNTSFQQVLAPPLPLVLRPPLRKKKSFSRVSTWLSRTDQQADMHPLQMNSISSTGGITNAPRAVTSRDGYYTSVTQQHGGNRDSNYTVSSGMSTFRDGDEQRSISDVASQEDEASGRGRRSQHHHHSHQHTFEHQHPHHHHLQHSDAGDADEMDDMDDEQEEIETETQPTTWSPGSTPVTKHDRDTTPTSMLARTATFGHHQANSPRSQRSVGVAF